MTETAWILERAYGLRSLQIAAALESMLAANVLHVQCEQVVFTAMVKVKAGRGSFADALIAAFGVEAGCKHTVTVDRKAARLSGFVLA